jgi:hypothetical protein
MKQIVLYQVAGLTSLIYHLLTLFEDIGWANSGSLLIFVTTTAVGSMRCTFQIDWGGRFLMNT